MIFKVVSERTMFSILASYSQYVYLGALGLAPEKCFNTKLSAMLESASLKDMGDGKSEAYRAILAPPAPLAWVSLQTVERPEQRREKRWNEHKQKEDKYHVQ